MGENDCTVTAAGGNNVQVALGKIRIDGREAVIHTAPEEIEVVYPPSVGGTYIIAAEKNLTDAVRAIRLVVVKNDGQTSPPLLLDTEEVRQIPLAQISVPGGASSITDDMIQDKRSMSGLEVANETHNAAGFLLLPGYLEKIQEVSGAAIEPERRPSLPKQ